MNRNTSLELKQVAWMDTEAFAEWIVLYRIEYTTSLSQGKLWLSYYDESIFGLVPTGETLIVLKNLSLWYDNGLEEVHITESNYLDYDSGLFYKNRTGKYDPVEEELI